MGDTSVNDSSPENGHQYFLRATLSDSLLKNKPRKSLTYNKTLQQGLTNFGLYCNKNNTKEVMERFLQEVTETDHYKNQPYPVGIMSSQTSCYMSVLLQVICSIPHFYKIITTCSCDSCQKLEKGKKRKATLNGREKNLRRFIQLLWKMKTTRDQRLNISKFLRKMKYSVNMDQEEFWPFFSHMLEGREGRDITTGRYLCENMVI